MPLPDPYETLRAFKPIPRWLLDRFPPNVDALVACLSGRVTDDMLADIARADRCGEADELYLSLRTIRDSPAIDRAATDHAFEVLQLGTYLSPEPNYPRSVERLKFQHLQSLFCAAILFRAEKMPVFRARFLCSDETWQRFIRSALYLGGDVLAAACQHLTWRLPKADRYGHREFVALSLLILSLYAADTVITEAEADAVADMITSIEDVIREPTGVCTPDNFDPRTNFFTHVRWDDKPEWRMWFATLREKFCQATRLVALVMRLEQC